MVIKKNNNLNCKPNRKVSTKKLLLQYLEENSIVQIACSRACIARATYYRYRTEDAKFAEKADEALNKGRLLINDLAESQLIKRIKEGNVTSIIYWLKNNNNRYSEKDVPAFEKMDPGDKERQIKEMAKKINIALNNAGIATILRVEE